MESDHIHVPEDGRGPREVFVDGHKIDKVCYADTRRGIVDYYPQPIKVDKWGKRVISRRMRGRVEVVQVSHGN
ncbi:hypothetical protein SAMN05216571_101262 [Onishia taeanensis]|uniref:Uncharacterized protein n=1 Tax=Onishia taeanensis TaxID=284577 RepID=A0A1G7N6U5_9GAMM|nr:hypothetical protein [Halomonas taeanensis]SDF69775.1 hypothetical protein SAMN05216571_101262 [Halomonas taeanensis]